MNKHKDKHRNTSISTEDSRLDSILIDNRFDNRLINKVVIPGVVIPGVEQHTRYIEIKHLYELEGTVLEMKVRGHVIQEIVTNKITSETEGDKIQVFILYLDGLILGG